MWIQNKLNNGLFYRNYLKYTKLISFSKIESIKNIITFECKV